MTAPREAITQFPVLASVAGDDLVPVVDVHDLSSPTGTTKKITVDNLLLGIPVPGNGRTVANLPAYNDNNADFNVADFAAGTLGVSAASDTAALRAAVSEAAAFAANGTIGARVTAPPTLILLNDQVVFPAGVTFSGRGMRSTLLRSSYPGYALQFGTSGASLAYGCGIENVAFDLTNTASAAIQAIGTAGFSAQNLYIGGVVSGNCTGVFIDGGTAANIFTVLQNVICNHMKLGLHLGTTGSQVVTSVTASGVNVLTDMQGGDVGLQVDALCGAGSRFFGGNVEHCSTGVSLSGIACQFFGTRFENNNTSVILNSGTQANAFLGCFGWTVGTVTDNSGNTTNTFLGNHASNYANYPADTLSTLASGITFGPNSASITNPAQIAIANNATGTFTVSPCCQLVVYDSGVTANAAQLLITTASAGTKMLLTQVNSIFSLTPGTASKINFSLSGTTLSIENKLGSDTTVKLLLTKLA